MHEVFLKVTVGNVSSDELDARIWSGKVKNTPKKTKLFYKLRLEFYPIPDR